LSAILSAALSRALRERGLASISRREGRTGFGVTILRLGVRPHVH
jgi:hypothetical protein